jgi:hypothetical protein
VLGVISSFLLYWYADAVLQLPRPTIQTLIFLKLVVAGHLTIYVTRNQRWFWSDPWPSARLFVTCEATQILGTLNSCLWHLHSADRLEIRVGRVGVRARLAADRQCG